MSITSNKDIDYVVKDFDSTIDAIISFATVNYGSGTSANKLWTNFNNDSFSRTWAEIVAYVADVFFFYFDSQATEAYLQTATIRNSVELIAKQFGYTLASSTSSSGIATFTVTGPVTIPRGFKVQASNGSQFFVTSNVTAISAGTINATVLQGELVLEQFVAQGLQNEEITLKGPNVIQDLNNVNPIDITPQVTVSGNDYTLVPSFINNNGTDSDAVLDSLGEIVGGGGRVFTLGINAEGSPYITFGDGIFGRKVSPGETISITYRTGGGTAGNIAKESLTTLVSNLPEVSSITNNADFSGGSDEQTINQLRDLIPASLRTLQRAVAEKDYSDILVANFREVFAASTEPNTSDPGVDINVYVIPNGNGITKISDNTVLKSTLSNYLDRRKTVTVQFRIQDAFEIGILITLDVHITNTASKTTVRQAIQTALGDLFSLTTGGQSGNGIGFAESVLLNEISNVVESIDGIDRFEIRKLTYRPRISENVIGLLTEYTNAGVTIFPNISESEWLIGAAGPITRDIGDPLFINGSLITYTYTSGTGVIQYASAVDLSLVSPGDIFTDGAPADFGILAVDTINYTITIPTGQTVNVSSGGTVSSGATTYQAYHCYKKTLATTSNLSEDSLTDNNLDFSVVNSTGSALEDTLLLDNSQIFVPQAYSTGNFYLVDSSGNIWEIVDNDASTLRTSSTAVNDAGITAVVSGVYKIVKKLSGHQLLFNSNIFNIQYNTDNTFISVGGQFNQIGTIGDPFEISKLQVNKGNLGIPIDINTNTLGVLALNATPDLNGVSSEFVLVDSSGQIFKLVAIDNSNKQVTIQSNLTPVLGVGASITKRYYNDSEELSIILGVSTGEVTPADIVALVSTLNAYGRAYVGGIPNRKVDTFTFRTSRFADDIINLRSSEIPQLDTVNDLAINIFGGVT